MARPKATNVREHLKHIQILLDGFEKYGDCPAVREEVTRLSFMNRSILRKHEEKRSKGDRHDIR